MKNKLAAVGLSVIIFGLGASGWLLKAEKITQSNFQPPPRKQLQITKEQNSVKEFKTEDLYQGQQPLRKSPFLTGSYNQVKFSYSRAQKEQSVQTKGKKQKQGTKKKDQSTTNKIKPIKLDLTLRGVVKRKGQTLVIVTHQQKSYLLQVGTTIKGYQIKEIAQKKVIMSKNNQLYHLKSQLKIDNN